MRQKIEFARSYDNIRLAWTQCGSRSSRTPTTLACLLAPESRSKLRRGKKYGGLLLPVAFPVNNGPDSISFMDSFYLTPTSWIRLIALGAFIIAGLAGRSVSACEVGAGGPWPDAGFGDNGHALLQFETDGQRGDLGNALAVQDDGRILIAGFAVLSDRRDGAVLRLLPDGSIDTSFGIQGRRLLGIASEDGIVQITDIQLQSDGRIVLFGRDRDRGLVFVRLHADGSFDHSFDLNGIRIVLLEEDSNTSAGMAIDNEGRLIGVGSMGIEDPAQCALIVRLEPNGAMDASFGANGRVCLLPDDESPGATTGDVAALPDGKILVAGSARSGDAIPSENVDMFALRLASDGTPDPDFGNAGWRLVAFDQGSDFRDFAHVLNVDDGGGITLAGSAASLQSESMAMARLTPGGELDAGFGSSGRVLIPFEHDDQLDSGSAATGMIRLNDDRLLVAGVATRQHSSVAFRRAGAAAMLNADGSIDTCFEENGRWVQALPGLQTSLFRDLASHDDRIYLVGNAEVPRDDDPSLLRRDILIAAFSLSGSIFSDRFE